MRTIEQFIASIQKQDDGCWLWAKATTSIGYGQVRWLGKITLAHRVSYQLFVGEIPEKFDIEHHCEVRKCVNPDHLEAVPHRINMLRSKKTFARINAEKTHCKNGHQFNEENTRYGRHGNRSCRACGREAQARHREKYRRIDT